MERGSLKRRLAAILCADVQGYSRMMGAGGRVRITAQLLDAASGEAAEIRRRTPTYKLATLQGRTAIVRDRSPAEGMLAACREMGLE